MLSRALSLATVTLLIGCLAAIPVRAQEISMPAKALPRFSPVPATPATRAPRGLLKTVPAGSLPGFLRQHYTTSSDMASLLSGFLISNGAADTPGRPRPTEQPKDARPRRLHPNNSTASAARYVPQHRPRSRQARRGRVSRRDRTLSEVPTAANRLPSRSSSKRGKPDEPPKADAAKDEPARDEPAKEDTPQSETAKEARKPPRTTAKDVPPSRLVRLRPNRPRSMHPRRAANPRRCGPIRFRRSRPRRPAMSAAVANGTSEPSAVPAPPPAPGPAPP